MFNLGLQRPASDKSVIRDSLSFVGLHKLSSFSFKSIPTRISSAPEYGRMSKSKESLSTSTTGNVTFVCLDIAYKTFSEKNKGKLTSFINVPNFSKSGSRLERLKGRGWEEDWLAFWRESLTLCCWSKMYNALVRFSITRKKKSKLQSTFLKAVFDRVFVVKRSTAPQFDLNMRLSMNLSIVNVSSNPQNYLKKFWAAFQTFRIIDTNE